MGNGLLIGLWQFLKFLCNTIFSNKYRYLPGACNTYTLYHGHFRFIGCPATFRVRPVSVTEFAIRILGGDDGHGQGFWLPQGCVDARNMFPQEWGYHLTNELLGHVGQP